MVCCLLCFDDGPIDGDARSGYGNTFAIGMIEAPCREPLCFCLSFTCSPCAQYQIRSKALQGDLSQYKCCQGYYDNKCFRAGKCGDQGNSACLCIEACFCHSCAISSTRQLVLDTRNLRPDPCDNRIIRFSNCIQMLACVFHILAMVDQGFRDLADVLDLIA